MSQSDATTSTRELKFARNNYAAAILGWLRHFRFQQLSSKPISHVGLQPPFVAYNLARAAYDARADAVVISGAGMRTVDIASQFERDCGIPLVTSCLATIWASLQAAGVREPIMGYGRLLEQQPALRWVRIPRP